MKQNLKFKVIIMSTAAFFIFGALGVFSIAKAFADDPKLIDKIATEMKFSKNGNFNLSFYNDSDAAGDYTEAISNVSFSESAEEIKVSAITAEVVIRPSTDKQIVVKAKGKTKGGISSKLLRTTFVNNKLTIEEPDDGSTEDVTIEVLIPNQAIKNMLVRSVSGDIEIEDVNLEKTTIQTVSGNIKLAANQLASAEINSVSGDVEVALKDAEQTNPVIQTLSGQIKNSLTISGKGKNPISIKTVSGDVTLSAKP